MIKFKFRLRDNPFVDNFHVDFQYICSCHSDNLLKIVISWMIPYIDFYSSQRGFAAFLPWERRQSIFRINCECQTLIRTTFCLSSRGQFPHTWSRTFRVDEYRDSLQYCPIRSPLATCCELAFFPSYIFSSIFAFSLLAIRCHAFLKLPYFYCISVLIGSKPQTYIQKIVYLCY